MHRPLRAVPLFYFPLKRPQKITVAHYLYVPSLNSRLDLIQASIFTAPPKQLLSRSLVIATLMESSGHFLVFILFDPSTARSKMITFPSKKQCLHLVCVASLFLITHLTDAPSPSPLVAPPHLSSLNMLKSAKDQFLCFYLALPS